jgi:hypothetical protein
MATYYRFQNDEPERGESVHCYTSFSEFKRFISNMKEEDPDFRYMKLWEIDGTFIESDGDDAIVKVNSAHQITL